MMAQTHGKDNSLLPYFPGYKFEKGVSTYRGEEVGEGGYVYAEPGMHGNVALLDKINHEQRTSLGHDIVNVSLVAERILKCSRSQAIYRIDSRLQCVCQLF